MPTLYILAGPNGSGKTTFYSTAIDSGFISYDLPFVNVDLITQSLGNYTEENYLKAQDIYRNRLQGLLRDLADFMIESNLADSRSYEWLSNIIKAGYHICLYFLSTDDVLVNIGRVKRRVAEGGHDVSEALIRTRYNQSHSYLTTKLQIFNEVYLIDNTTDLPEVQVTIDNNKIIFKHPEIKVWALQTISVFEKLYARIK